jgi:hypothetical protein
MRYKYASLPSILYLPYSYLLAFSVPCWDDVAVSNAEARESKHSESKSIGYVLDEW